MNQLMQISYPREIPDALNMTREEFEQEARLSMAVKLFETGKISSGKSAEIAGMDRVTFLMNLHRYKVSMFNDGIQGLEQEIKNA